MILNLKVLEKNVFLKLNILFSVVVFFFSVMKRMQPLESDIGLNPFFLNPSILKTAFTSKTPPNLIMHQILSIKMEVIPTLKQWCKG